MDFTPNRQNRNNMSLNVSFISQDESSNANKSLNRTLNGNNTSQEASTHNRFNTLTNTSADRTHFFTGTAERVLTWSKVFKQRCYFEVIASVVSVQDPQNDRRIILVKDKKGPILQVLHYLHHDVEQKSFAEGQILRCVGYMTGVNTLTAVNIRQATAEEIATLKRYCYIGDFTIAGLMNAEENQRIV